jgi:hypothetical protein
MDRAQPGSWKDASGKYVREVAIAATQDRADALGAACRYVIGELPGAPLRDACADLVHTGVQQPPPEPGMSWRTNDSRHCRADHSQRSDHARSCQMSWSGSLSHRRSSREWDAEGADGAIARYRVLCTAMRKRLPG